MEILSPDESISQIKPGQTRELGRGQGLSSLDRTISRRHVSFAVPPFTDRNQEPRLQFEVLGRNPIYVHKNGKVKVFRRFQRGEIGSGDMFCVTAKDPVWYTLREVENCAESVRQNDLAGKLDSDIGFNGIEDVEKEGVGIPDMNPVKEFGFVVIGHEFDSYPKKMIKDFKNWNWFLEDAGKDSEDDDSREKRTRKRKKGENDDEDWTGESEEDKDLINKTKKAPKPIYVTRSKDLGKPLKYKSKGKGSTRKGESREVDEEEEDEEDEDEEDQTLGGGFIVDDENLELEEEVDEMDDEDEEEIGDESDEDDDE